LPVFIALCHDREWEVRKAAVDVIVSIGNLW